MENKKTPYKRKIYTIIGNATEINNLKEAKDIQEEEIKEINKGQEEINKGMLGLTDKLNTLKKDFQLCSSKKGK